MCKFWRENETENLTHISFDTHTQKLTTVHYTYKTACNLLLKGRLIYLYIGITTVLLSILRVLSSIFNHGILRAGSRMVGPCPCVD